jgi:hypothetical protein
VGTPRHDIVSAPSAPTPLPYGDYIVYVDESGDHGLASMDPNYPIFVLAFCVFEKRALASEVVPAMMHFKFSHFGHDQVVLHEHEIRKTKGPFRFLTDAERRQRFMADLNALVEAAPFTVVAVIIDKERLVRRYSAPENPYMLAMGYGLERVCSFLRERGQAGRRTHVVFEARGAKEDAELELEFRRVTAEGNAHCRGTPVDLLMADKKTITTGLQLADLVARPIGLHVLRPGQPNRAYELIELKLRRSPGGQVAGWGLKVFPT